MYKELITDRTQAHVDRLKVLREKGWNNLTSAERTEWYGEAAKGAYNYSDMNRVESAVEFLSNWLAWPLSTKTDWSVWDIPTQEDISRYLYNISEIRQIAMGSWMPGGPDKDSVPEAPTTMNNFTYESANDIEKILKFAYEVVGVTE